MEFTFKAISTHRGRTGGGIACVFRTDESHVFYGKVEGFESRKCFFIFAFFGCYVCIYASYIYI